MEPSIADDEYIIIKLARTCAEQKSGLRGATPTKDDFELASKLYAEIEKDTRS